MAATIPQKFRLRICHNAKCSFKPVVSGSNMIALSKKQMKTRYDYNLTIMKSPKPATDNRFK
jgi:hypothetical protein